MPNTIDNSTFADYSRQHVPLKVAQWMPAPIRFNYVPGNGTRFDVWLTKCDGLLIVAILNMHVVAEFRTPPHPSYVAEKLSLSGDDIDVMTALIVAQFNPPTR